LCKPDRCKSYCEQNWIRLSHLHVLKVSLFTCPTIMGEFYIWFTHSSESNRLDENLRGKRCFARSQRWYANKTAVRALTAGRAMNLCCYGNSCKGNAYENTGLLHCAEYKHRSYRTCYPKSCILRGMWNMRWKSNFSTYL
jgi:hypothetical protein